MDAGKRTRAMPLKSKSVSPAEVVKRIDDILFTFPTDRVCGHCGGSGQVEIDGSGSFGSFADCGECCGTGLAFGCEEDEADGGEDETSGTEANAMGSHPRLVSEGGSGVGREPDPSSAGRESWAVESDGAVEDRLGDAQAGVTLRTVEPSLCLECKGAGLICKPYMPPDLYTCHECQTCLGVGYVRR